jgi:hypothetical protein
MQWMPTIGFFSAGSASALSNWVAALVQRLRELGWIEGRTVARDRTSGSPRSRPNPRECLDVSTILKLN